MIPPLPHKYLGLDRKRREETQGAFYLWNRSGYGEDYQAKDFSQFLLHWESSGVKKPINWSIVSFKVCVSLLIFCLVDLSIGVSGVLSLPLLLCYC